MLPCEAVQFTALFDELATCAMNWLVDPDDIVTESGVSATAKDGGGGVIVIVAVADLVGSAAVVA
jgi:hypothetical protein